LHAYIIYLQTMCRAIFIIIIIIIIIIKT